MAGTVGRRREERVEDRHVGDGGAEDRHEDGVVGAPRAGLAPVDTRVRNRPRGLFAIGLVTLLTGAWAGIVPYVGPLFGYRSNGLGSWAWTLQHGVLYLIPGAAAVFAGLLILGMVPRSWLTRARLGAGFAGALAIACGAWLVLGPVAWPIFNGPLTTVFGTATPTNNFLNWLGYNLGPGILLTGFGAMALKAMAPDKAVRVARRHHRGAVSA